MADLVMGAMGSLIPKLGELLKEQYNLQTGVKKRVRDLTMELEGAQAALRKVGQLPWDQLDEQVKLWAREVRESSYDMEDVLDTFLVRVQGRDSAEKKSSLKRLGKKMTNLFKKSNARRKISIDVKDIMSHLDEVTERRRRYTVDHIVARPATAPMVDPRLGAMYNKVKNLVGIDKSSNELMSILQSQQRGDVPNAKMKIVAVFGVGGLGKTTLAKAVYDKLKGDFDCSAFVPVGRNPDLKNIIKMILIGLDKERYMQFNFAQYDEIHQFIDELKDFHLKNKRTRRKAASDTCIHPTPYLQQTVKRHCRCHAIFKAERNKDRYTYKLTRREARLRLTSYISFKDTSRRVHGALLRRACPSAEPAPSSDRSHLSC